MIDIKQGLANLTRHIKIAPEDPGVYRMIGEDEEVLYVGKAKNIKKRIVAYSHLNKLPVRLQRMVAQIKRMEFIIVESEARALLVENELIKKFKPRYNILLKDDKSFPHLMIDVGSDFPCLRKYRGSRADKNKYFGPFASVMAVNSVVDILQKAFLLRSCRDSVFKNRERPCLMYQIKRCSAPCVGRISKEDYRRLVNEAIDFLEGRNSKIQAELSAKMQEASAQQDYETALVYRDRIRALTNVQSTHNVEYADIKSCDVVAIARKNDVVCIQIFFIRSGQNCGNTPYFPAQVEDAGNAEVLEAFLGSFYSSHLPPKEIIVSEPLENKEFLEKAIGAKINTYQKGNKAAIVKNVAENAKASIDRRIAMMASVKSNLEEFKEIFGLPRIPQRIEIYDNSHNQGSYAIGAMVVATPDGFDKKSYRTFNIKNSEITNDDFAMMKEVLSRRFARMDASNRPDVILLDGGRGHVSVIRELMREIGCDIPVFGMVKDDYHKTRALTDDTSEISIARDQSVFMFIYRLQEEVHRYTITRMENAKTKTLKHSTLEEIDGIGALKAKALLNHFRSIAAIKKADKMALMRVPGITGANADAIIAKYADENKPKGNKK